jgi:hypothetical protein
LQPCRPVSKLPLSLITRYRVVTALLSLNEVKSLKLWDSGAGPDREKEGSREHVDLRVFSLGAGVGCASHRVSTSTSAKGTGVRHACPSMMAVAGEAHAWDGKTLQRAGGSVRR